MNINTLCNKISKIAILKKISDKEFEVQTGAKLAPTTPITIFLVCENNKFLLSDKKETLKFMNKIYELKANDVKSCINDVLKHYKFQVKEGTLLAEIKNEETLNETFYNFIMCIGQLVNMFLFFDKP